MKIVLYSNQYRDDLELLLNSFSLETFGKEMSNVDLFVDNHYAIYLCLNSYGLVIGFSSFIINDYFGLRDSVVGNSYLFVLEKYRGTKANYLLNIQSGVVCKDLNIPLEHYYSSESSLKISSKLSGKKIYEAYIYEVDEVSKLFDKLVSKVRIK